MQFSTSYTPAAADLVGHASNVTGATWAITTTSAGDGLAHTVTIRNDSATDHSAKTVVLVGTDVDGNALTETMNLPGSSATVTSTKFFKTLTSATPSATIGADTMDIGWSAVSVGPSHQIERTSVNGATLAAVVTGTVNFTAEETFGEMQNSAAPPSTNTWVALGGMTSKTATTVASATVAASGVRLKINSITAGATVVLQINHSLSY